MLHIFEDKSLLFFEGLPCALPNSIHGSHTLKFIPELQCMLAMLEFACPAHEQGSVVLFWDFDFDALVADVEQHCALVVL